MYFLLQEEQNRGKTNWEHLNEELHVLIIVEDTIVKNLEILIILVAKFFKTQDLFFSGGTKQG